MGTGWQQSGRPRGDDYDERWAALAAKGRNLHGEADLIESLLSESAGTRVLDAGCGTGRVAIELARRGFSVTGVDADATMLGRARSKAPTMSWLQADLAELPDSLGSDFDVVALAGNVMIFLDPGTEGRVLLELGRRIGPGGMLVAGFQLRPRALSLGDYDRWCEAAGLQSVTRWATWDRKPYDGGNYAVSVHRRGAAQP